MFSKNPKSLIRHAVIRIALISFVCGATIFASATASAAEGPDTMMKTVGGVLRVVEVDNVLKQLTFNNKLVSNVEGGRSFPLEESHVSIKQKFTVEGNDVVFVRINCGGSSCGGSSTLWIVLITPRGKISVLEGIEANEEGIAVVQAEGNTLKIETTVGYRKKKTNRWTYANGKVEKSK
jgi:hypothetical protein